jgi:hypothetical protein
MSWLITGSLKSAEGVVGVPWDQIPDNLKWSPSLITTALWLDGSDNTTVFSDAGTTQATNGGAVQQWNDKSGNARHFSQGTLANRPAFNTTAINGKPALVFDGSNDSLGAGSAVIPTTHSLFILFVPTIESARGILVGQWQAAQTGRTLFSCNSNCASNPVSGRLEIFNSTTTQGGCTSAGGGGFVTDTSITNTPTIIESICTTGSESWKLLKNGTEYDSATITALYQGINTALGTVSASGTDQYYDGQIAEVVLTSSVVSTDIRQRIEGYLAHKWGLTANLPSDHPYKVNVPTP